MPTPNRFFQLSLIFLVALNFIPHFSTYTVPTLAVGGICLTWRLLYEYQLVPLPNFFTKLGMVITLTYLVFLNYGQILGLEAGSALLICAVALKLVDRVGYRDAMVLLFLNFMLLLAGFFESQTLGMTLFAVFDLVITTALLVQLHDGARVKFNIASLLRTGFKLSLQIMPFMLLLFFIFPRFSTRWLQIQNSRKNMSGFSDTMEPGSIATVAGSESIAFRVRFQNQIPSPPERYWRGLVLSQTEGMKWTRGTTFLKHNQALMNFDIPLARYEVLLEPNFNRWLFVLDYPFSVRQRRNEIQKITLRFEGDVYQLTRNPDGKIIYDATARSLQKETLSLEQRAMYIKPHKEKDQRVINFVAELKNKTNNAQEMALQLMKFYQTQFRYTLDPGRMHKGTLAEFLFEKRQGFCEHFAASFASLMRLGGYPARVVLGFQGGIKNNLSDYYIVTGRDAHAWTEVWSEEESRWLRFDPTIMVSPLRFEIGGEAFHSVAEDERDSLTNGDDFINRYSQDWLRSSLLFVDAISTSWNLFLLGYDQSGQKSFFAQLGFDNINQEWLLLWSLLLLFVFYLWIRISHRQKEKKLSVAQKAYLEFQDLMSDKGLERHSYEGPRDFMLRCQSQFPGGSKAIHDFIMTYLAQEYGKSQERPHFKALLTAVRRIPVK